MSHSTRELRSARTGQAASHIKRLAILSVWALLLHPHELLLPGVQADLARKPLSIQPEDRFAHPKWEVKMWNHLPISEGEARAWEEYVRRGSGTSTPKHGMDFLDGDRTTDGSRSPPRDVRGNDAVLRIAAAFKGHTQTPFQIAFDSSSTESRSSSSNTDLEANRNQLPPFQQTVADDESDVKSSASGYQVIRMKLPSTVTSRPQAINSTSSSQAPHPQQPRLDDYLCLISPPPPVSPQQDAAKEETDEARTLGPKVVDDAWRNLDHLDGKCLYHRQGWFTYRYCHGSHIRQFREAPHVHPHPPGGYIPQEDPNYEAYDLGFHPSESKRRALEALAQQGEAAGPPRNPNAPVSVNSSPAIRNRYLSQSWGEGTECDVTGEPRTTEVQFHCRMDGVDSISFIKEVSTCHYVLVIHTPNLCFLPGFHIPSASETPSNPIVCRQIVPDDSYETFIASRLARLEDRERFLLGQGHGHGRGSVSTADGHKGPGSLHDEMLENAVRGRMKGLAIIGDKFPEGYQMALPALHAPSLQVHGGPSVNPITTDAKPNENPADPANSESADEAQDQSQAKSEASFDGERSENEVDVPFLFFDTDGNPLLIDLDGGSLPDLATGGLSSAGEDEIVDIEFMIIDEDGQQRVIPVGSLEELENNPFFSDMLTPEMLETAKQAWKQLKQTKDPNNGQSNGDRRQDVHEGGEVETEKGRGEEELPPGTERNRAPRRPDEGDNKHTDREPEVARNHKLAGLMADW